MLFPARPRSSADRQRPYRHLLDAEPPWDPGLLSCHAGQPLDARWRLAVQRVRCRSRLRSTDEPWLRKAILYLRALVSCRGEADHARLAARLPDVHAAYFLRTSDDKMARGTVEARLLAGQTIEEVAAKCSLPTDAVAAYHALFFDVLGKLHARSYILTRAIGMKSFLEMAETDIDLMLKRAAYLKGPIFLEMFLDYYRTPLVMPQQLDGLTREQLEELSRLLLTRLIILAWTLPPTKILRVKMLQGLLHQLDEVVSSWPGQGTSRTHADSPPLPADRDAWWAVWRQAFAAASSGPKPEETEDTPLP